LGLKENVIIGRLIPAGSGMPRHRDREIDFHPDVEEELRPRPRDVLPETDAMQALLEEIEAARGLAGDEDLELLEEEFFEEEIPEAPEDELAEVEEEPAVESEGKEEAVVAEEQAEEE
jgi:hypothetical protein